MADPALDDARDLLTFLDVSPSPFHAVGSVRTRLEAAGFTDLDERDRWVANDTSGSGPGTGRYFIVRGGSLVAWADDDPARLDGGFRIIGAHTDSPNLRIKPRPELWRAGYRQLGVEVYGGVLLNSWLDRDLGLSGRVALRPGSAGGPPDVRLVRVDRPLLRIPQLAIHLDRNVTENGLVLNPQQHLVPVWGLESSPDEQGLAGFLAGELDCSSTDILSWDLMLHDLTPAALLGRHDELLSSARLDNLLSCWAATRAIVAAADGDAEGGVPVICLFDHEEIGSESSTGAAGALLPTILERIATAGGRDRDGFARVLASSRCVSADGAHATHPNYAERHEPNHWIRTGGGPVIKLNANVRYATDAESAAWFKLACEAAEVPVQEFVVRSDLPCGSTIGPITAARLGIPTVDAGVAQLSMHSARELCGAADPHLFVRALTAFVGMN